MDEPRLTLHDHELAALMVTLATERVHDAKREKYLIERLRTAISNANHDNRRVEPLIHAARFWLNHPTGTARASAALEADRAVNQFFYWRSLVVMDEITARRTEVRGAA